MDDMTGRGARTAQPTGQVLLCRSCTRLGRCRLGLTDERLVGNELSLTRLQCGADHEGGPGVAHGGWTAAVMDEALGHLLVLCKSMGVTKELRIEFRKPVPIGRDLELRAWSDRREGNRWHNVGELRLAATGAVLARAEGIFVERDASHFERHARWLVEQDQIVQGGGDKD